MIPSSTVRLCPVCNGSKRRTLYTQRFQEGLLGDGYDVVVCRECGAGFADGIPTQPELDRYYAEQSKYAYDGSGGAESAYDFRRFEMIADQVAPFLPSRDARILDIGCATGGLLSVFKKRGYANVVGADPSPACAKAALKLHGVDVRVATLGQLDRWKDQFDLVLMVGVLEHLREVRAAVNQAAGRLAPGGMFYAAVPDVEGLADCRNAPFQQFSMEHVNFFSASSLGRLMASCGFVQRELWQRMVEWRAKITEPTVAGLYLKAPVAAASLDRITEPALLRYLDRSREDDKKIRDQIEGMVLNRAPLLVWGAGALTRRLLATTRLAEANIIGFVDSNAHLRGSRLAERPVFSPAEIVGRTESILICSMAFEDEIARTIRNEFRLGNDLIKFS